MEQNKTWKHKELITSNENYFEWVYEWEIYMRKELTMCLKFLVWKRFDFSSCLEKGRMGNKCGIHLTLIWTLQKIFIVTVTVNTPLASFPVFDLSASFPAFDLSVPFLEPFLSLPVGAEHEIVGCHTTIYTSEGLTDRPLHGLYLARNWIDWEFCFRLAPHWNSRHWFLFRPLPLRTLSQVVPLFDTSVLT